MTMRTISLSVAGIIVIGALGACSDDTDPTVVAQEQFCSSADEVRTEIDALVQLFTEPVTQDDLQSQADDLRTAVEDTADAAQALGDAVAADLQPAGDALEDALSALADAGLADADARAQARTATTDYIAAVDEITSDLGCGPAS